MTQLGLVEPGFTTVRCTNLIHFISVSFQKSLEIGPVGKQDLEGVIKATS